MAAIKSSDTYWFEELNRTDGGHIPLERDVKPLNDPRIMKLAPKKCIFVQDTWSPGNFVGDNQCKHCRCADYQHPTHKNFRGSKR
jgi:hypothetical protein